MQPPKSQFYRNYAVAVSSLKAQGYRAFNSVEKDHPCIWCRGARDMARIYIDVDMLTNYLDDAAPMLKEEYEQRVMVKFVTIGARDLTGRKL